MGMFLPWVSPIMAPPGPKRVSPITARPRWNLPLSGRMEVEWHFGHIGTLFNLFSAIRAFASAFAASRCAYASAVSCCLGEISFPGFTVTLKKEFPASVAGGLFDVMPDGFPKLSFVAGVPHSGQNFPSNSVPQFTQNIVFLLWGLSISDTVDCTATSVDWVTGSLDKSAFSSLRCAASFCFFLPLIYETEKRTKKSKRTQTGEISCFLSRLKWEGHPNQRQQATISGEPPAYTPKRQIYNCASLSSTISA